MTRGYRPEMLRAGLRTVDLRSGYRIIHRRHGAEPLGAVPAPSRFSDPEGRYAVLYAAGTVRGALWETLARNRFARRGVRVLPRADVEARVVVSIVSSETLSMIDLRNDGAVRIGAPAAVAHDSNHAAGRALSRAVHALVPEADGFLFQSRFTGHACVAVFERAFDKLLAIDIRGLTMHADFLDALDEYDIRLTPPPGRLT